MFVLLALFACKKDEDNVVVEEKENLYAISIHMPNSRTKSEKAIVVGTKTELEGVLKGSGKPVALKKASAKNNVFVPVVGPVKPPVDLCWEEIQDYYDAHVQEWLQIANANCQPYGVCLTCPNAGGGLFVLYEIKPTAAKCLALDAQFELAMFDFSENDFDTEAVGNFIVSK